MRRRSLFGLLIGIVVASPAFGDEDDGGPSRYDDPNADLPDPDDPDYDPLRDDSDEGEEEEIL
jgi:hypothetical protein